jgi:hypothetical protein
MIVRKGRYDVFQLGEVAVPRALFAEILRRIDRLSQGRRRSRHEYGDQRSTATQRARCVHDYEGRHKPGPNAGRKFERPVLRGFEADPSPRNLACRTGAAHSRPSGTGIWGISVKLARPNIQ